MAPTISDSAYAILRVLAARGRRVVTTAEIREAVGFDPHPMLGRDIVGRRWADPWDSVTLPEKRGVQITELGKAAFELGRLERGDAAPEPVRAPVIRTGKARGESGAERIALKLRATDPSAQLPLDDVPCPPGHDITAS